jgi:hypothetical protein
VALTATASTSTMGRGRVNDVERLAELVKEFVDGFQERIEYKVLINGGIEARARSMRQLGLIDQLTGEVSGYAPVSTGARWGQPGSRPPGTLDLLDLVHHIDAYLAAQATHGRGRLERLRSLVTIATNRGPDWTQDTCHDLRRFRKTARIMLQYDVPAVPLRDTVCGDCGGTLVVAVNADSDVRCVGTSEQVSCGMIYERWRWVDLLPEDA